MYVYACVLEFFLQWINDSPRVEGNSVAAELRLRRAVTSAECRVTTIDNHKTVRRIHSQNILTILNFYFFYA